jgi:hypothetical protein
MPTTPTYYVTDQAKLTLLEIMRLSNRMPTPKLLLAKLLGKPVRAGVPTLYDNVKQIEFDGIPDDVRAEMEPLTRALQSARFTRVLAQKVCHSKGHIGFATYLRSEDRLSAAAVVVARISTGSTSRSETVLHVNSRRLDESVISTTNARPRLKSPPEIRAEYLAGAKPDKVLARHQRRLLNCTDVVPVSEAEYADKVLERIRRNRDFQVERGVFVPATAEEMVRYQDQIVQYGVV